MTELIILTPIGDGNYREQTFKHSEYIEKKLTELFAELDTETHRQVFNRATDND